MLITQKTLLVLFDDSELASSAASDRALREAMGNGGLPTFAYLTAYRAVNGVPGRLRPSDGIMLTSARARERGLARVYMYQHVRHTRTS